MDTAVATPAPKISSGQGFRILAVVPTLGERPETLVRTIESLAHQEGPSVDVILVARIATPLLVAIAKKHGVKLMADGGNISSAINVGFACAGPEHRYACWLGDDDMLRPGALERASASLERSRSAVVAYGACDYIDHDGGFIFNREPPRLAPFFLQFFPGLIKQEACLFRLDAVRAVGGLNEKLKYTMDLDLLLRLRRLGPMVRVDHTLAAFCWHAGSLTVANRMASLVEAQSVQSRHARGVISVLLLVMKLPIRWLIRLVSWKINRGMHSSRIPPTPSSKGN